MYMGTATHHTDIRKFDCRLEGDIVVIDIFDYIDSWWGYGLDMLRDELAEHGDGVTNIKVNINSGGGSVFEALGIANLLRGHSASVETVGIGLVGSAATFILLCGDTITMAKNSYLMVHKPSSSAWGEAGELRKTADFLDKIEEGIVDMYTEAIEANGKLINSSLDQTRDQVAEWVEAETWMTAKEALNNGFIQKLSDAVEFINPDNIASIQSIINQFGIKRVPKSLLNQVKSMSTKKPKSKKGQSALSKLWNFLNDNKEELQEEVDNDTTTEEEDDGLQAALAVLKEKGYSIKEPTTDSDEDGEDPVGDESDTKAQLKSLVAEALKEAGLTATSSSKGEPSGNIDTGKKAKKHQSTKAQKAAFDQLAEDILSAR